MSGVYLLLRRNLFGAFVIGMLVISHWLLDAIVHQPDLPLYPGSTTLIGLNAWSSLPVTLAIELPLFALGVWLYVRATKPSDGVGRWSLWALIAFLLIIYAGNLFGSPPPNVKAIAWIGQIQWLTLCCGDTGLTVIAMFRGTHNVWRPVGKVKLECSLLDGSFRGISMHNLDSVVTRLKISVTMCAS